MPFIPVPETVEAEIRMSLDGQHIENTLYFTKIGGVTLAEAVALAGDLLIWWNTSYAVPLSSQLSLREVYMTDLETATGYTHTQPAPAPAPVGDVDFESEPNSVALCVSFRTNLRGRSFRGRNYVSGLPGNGVLQNTVEPATVAGIVSAYEDLLGVASAAGVSGVWSAGSAVWTVTASLFREQWHRYRDHECSRSRPHGRQPAAPAARSRPITR